MADVLEFDDETSRVVEEFNCSRGAVERRRRISTALALSAGENVLDVGCGPGHQVFELASLVEPGGGITGVDPADSAIAIAAARCSDLPNVNVEAGSVAQLPFDDQSFDVVMSSQVFEYLDDVDGALLEVKRVLRPGGRVLIHDTDWGALLWRSSDPQRMDRYMRLWDRHLADPSLPQSLGSRLRRAGFGEIVVEPIVQLETEFDPGSVSGVLMKFIVGYLESQGVPAEDALNWQEDLVNLGAADDYFFSSNEYMFLGAKPV